MSREIMRHMVEFRFDDPPPRSATPCELAFVVAYLDAWWSAFAAIWWDVGLVATPARQVLELASIAHDAVAEGRDEAGGICEQVPIGVAWVRRTTQVTSKMIQACRLHWEHASRVTRRYRKDHRRNGGSPIADAIVEALVVTLPGVGRFVAGGSFSVGGGG